MRPKLFFCYIKPISFSGQSAVSDFLVDGLSARGWNCKKIALHPFDRSTKNILIKYFQFIFRTIIAWFSLFRLIFHDSTILHLNLGQSLASFLRVSLPIFCLRTLRPDINIITSLHGSVFMTWRIDDFVTKVFLFYLNSSNTVTVLGEKQKVKLVSLGVSSEKIIVVPNTCDLKPASKSFVISKHRNTTLQVLHLSLLIESKGYPEFLDALELLSRDNLPYKVKGILCGPMAFTAYCERFVTEDEKSDWIKGKIDTINENGSSVEAQWIEGASGDAKKSLFSSSHIFVFPSRFPVEAQPLVLMEAMSAGCSLITSMAGEIPSTIDDSVAILEEKPTALSLACSIKKLAESEVDRTTMALSAVDKIREKYSMRVHLNHWEKILNDSAK